MARRNCLNEGSHLTSILSDDEQTFITQLIQHTGSYYWVAGKRYGGWKWEDGSVFFYTNWHPGRPNNDECLLLYPSWGYTWFDVPCFTSSYYISLTSSSY